MLRIATLMVGACRARAGAVGLPGRGSVPLPALATMVDVGSTRVLVDTGYGAAFFAATRSFPERLYRIATPVSLLPGQRLSVQLDTPPDLVMLTHLHADHISGLPELPKGIPVIASARAISHARGLSRVAALAAACPVALRDQVLARDPQPIEARPPIETGLPGFPSGYDLLGDGRLIALALPGHGVGQMGLWIPEARRFLIADAAYTRHALRTGQMPPRVVLRGLGDVGEYEQTFGALRRLAMEEPDIIFDPAHCPQTAP